MEYSNPLAIAKLLLDIQAPTLEECWEEGYEIAETHTLDDNPYKVNTANHYHWQEGWWARKFGIEEVSSSEIIAANDSSSLSDTNKSEHYRQAVVNEI